MKIKIRGLVFVGFAAAVFASSAKAEVPNGQATGVTVTSRAYTEKTYEHKAPALTVSNNEVEPAVWIGWNEEQTGANFPSGDAGQQWTKLQGDNYTEIVHNKSGHYVKLVNDKIAGSADVIAGSTGDGPLSTDYGDLTTAKAVYDFVTDQVGDGQFQPQVDEATQNHNTSTIPQVGMWNSSAGEPTWADLRAQPNGDGQDPSLGHLEVVRVEEVGGTGVEYKMDIKDDAIADDASAIEAVGGNGGTAHLVSDKLTTAKAVYDYVNGNDGGDGFHRKITESEARNLATLSSNGTAGYGVEIGYRTYDSTAAEGQQYGGSEWSVLTAKENNADINNSGNNHLAYLNIGKTGSDARPAFEIDIKPAALAEDAQAITTGGTATGDTAHLTRDRLTTAKAVYDFVTNYADGAYQPKIEDTDHSKVMIGVNTRTVTEGNYTYNSSWQELGDGTYIESSTSNGATTIDIKSGQVAGTIANANSVKLATEGAVYGYAVQKDWGSANANKTLVTNGSGIVTVSDTPAIPGTSDMPSECYGANATAHCALVSKWVAATGNDPSAPGYVAAHLELAWTVMADQTD